MKILAFILIILIGCRDSDPTACYTCTATGTTSIDGVEVPGTKTETVITKCDLTASQADAYEKSLKVASFSVQQQSLDANGNVITVTVNTMTASNCKKEYPPWRPL
ncbi:MAG: hypothetical protein AABY93_01570 [Bacteroidota bacterium]